MRAGEIDALLAFAQVAEHQSFAKAGAALSISTSAISQKIALLEERLGVRLLNRTTRSVSTTPAGDNLLTELEPAIQLFEHAVQSVNAFRRTPRGPLRISLPRMAVPYMGPLFSRFLQKYPDVELSLSITDGLVDIVREHFDAGIRGLGKIDRDMVAFRIGEVQRHVIVASPEYCASHPTLKTPTDLKSHPCIRHKPDGSRGIIPWRVKGSKGPIDLRVKGPLIVNDSQIGVQAAIDGIGLAYSVESYVSVPVSQGRLVSLLTDYAWEHPGFHIFYPKVKLPIPALRELIRFLREEAGITD